MQNSIIAICVLYIISYVLTRAAIFKKPNRKEPTDELTIIILKYLNIKYYNVRYSELRTVISIINYYKSDIIIINICDSYIEIYPAYKYSRDSNVVTIPIDDELFTTLQKEYSKLNGRHWYELCVILTLMSVALVFYDPLLLISSYPIKMAISQLCIFLSIISCGLMMASGEYHTIRHVDENHKILRFNTAKMIFIILSATLAIGKTLLFS